MALTISNPRPFEEPRRDDRVRKGIVTVTMDASYNAGGEAIAASDLASGLTSILGLKQVGCNTAACGYDFKFDTQTSTIKAYVITTGVEVAGAVDLSTCEITFEYAAI